MRVKAPRITVMTVESNMATVRTSRVYTISLPPELVQKAEALAKRDSRTISELFREAFRTYCLLA